MTAAVPFWDDIYAAWDKVRLGDVVLPGICSVSGAVKRDVEVKKSKGSDGASLKDNGYRPAAVSIEWRIYTEEQWRQAQAFLPQIHPRNKGGERRPVAIGHPAPNFLGVDIIYVKEIALPELTGDKELRIRISAIEWIEKPKPPKQGAGVKGGKPTQGNEDDLPFWDMFPEDFWDDAEQFGDDVIDAWNKGKDAILKENWPWGNGDDEEDDELSSDDLSDDYVDNLEDGGGFDDEWGSGEAEGST